MGWVAVLPISIYLGVFHPVVGSGILLGYGMGHFVDPDWDQIGITAAEGRIVNQIPIIGKFIVGYSTIYGAFFRRKHRTFFTHTPGISTAIRLVYLFWWLYFVIQTLYDWQIIFGLCVFIGLSLADSIHWTLDMLFPDIGKS